MTSADPRPRIVEAAFWCWAVAAMLLVLFGLLVATATAPLFFRGAGALFAVAGLALAYLAGRTRRGHSRFRWAAFALALTLVVLLILFDVLLKGLVWLLIIILLLIGAFAVTRDSATAWFDGVETGTDGG
jgi:hypothetical protein